MYLQPYQPYKSTFSTKDLVSEFSSTIEELKRTDLFGNIFSQSTVNFPPYNIITLEDGTYLIELAIAGFSKSDVTIEFSDGVLSVSGKKTKSDEKLVYQHHGIGLRNFVRTFTLEKNIVINEAIYEDGLLKISMKKIEPEVKKTSFIEIK